MPAHSTPTAGTKQLPQVARLGEPGETLDLPMTRLPRILDFSWSSDEAVDGDPEALLATASRLQETAIAEEFMEGLRDLCWKSSGEEGRRDPHPVKVWVGHHGGPDARRLRVLALFAFEEDAAQILELAREGDAAMRIRGSAVHISQPSLGSFYELVPPPRWADLADYSDTESMGTARDASELVPRPVPKAASPPRPKPVPKADSPPSPPMLEVRGIPYRNWYNPELLKEALGTVDAFLCAIASSIPVDKDAARWDLDVAHPYRAPAGSCWVNFAGTGKSAREHNAILGDFVSGAKFIQHGPHPFKIDELRLFLRFAPRHSGEARS